MKKITLDIIKKNRVYFKCLTENGYEVKLQISSLTNNLTLGKHELLVRDVSIRTKYGTDVIYNLEGEVKDDKITTLKHFKYNTGLIESCKALGGKWDAEEKAWVFSAIVEDAVEQLDALYNSGLISIEITARHDIDGYRSAVLFCGYQIACATGRDSGAHLCDGISKMSGTISSGGSMKNWATEISEGTTFRFQIPRKLLEKHLATKLEQWEITVLDDAMLAEKVLLLQIELLQKDTEIAQNRIEEFDEKALIAIEECIKIKKCEPSQYDVNAPYSLNYAKGDIQTYSALKKECEDRAAKNREEIARHQQALADLKIGVGE